MEHLGPRVSPSPINLNGFCGRKAPCFRVWTQQAVDTWGRGHSIESWTQRALDTSWGRGHNGMLPRQTGWLEARHRRFRWAKVLMGLCLFSWENIRGANSMTLTSAEPPPPFLCWGGGGQEQTLEVTTTSWWWPSSFAWKESAGQNTQDSRLTSKSWKIPVCWKPSKLW